MQLRMIVLALLGLVLAACAAPEPSPGAPTATPRLRPLPSGTPPLVVGVTSTPGVVPTPVIIASPTPTATPVTHVVQEGETMLGIALDYGVSLENLQAANPEVNPRFLSINTVLIIPPPEGGFAVAATNLAPPPPAPVDLGEPVCYALPTAGTYCLVAARNPGQSPLENVSARVVLAGADGLPMASAVAFAALDLIPPGAAMPLAVLFDPLPRPVMATEVEVVTGNLALEPAPPGRAASLTVQDLRGGELGGRWTATGLAVNLSGRAVAETWAALTLFDAQGAIAGYRKRWLGGPLGPGESQAFSLTADLLGASVATFTVLAEGYP